MNLFKPVAVHPIIPKDGGDANSSAQHDISEPSISESNEESTTMSSPGQALPITSQSKNQSKPTQILRLPGYHQRMSYCNAHYP